MPFLGLKALVVAPEVAWEEWDVCISGALDERGFEVSYGDLPADQAALSTYDLIALDIRQRLSEPETARLESYVAEGGSLYVSWGGSVYVPVPRLLEGLGSLMHVLRVKCLRGVRSLGLTILEGPLAHGLATRDIAFAKYVPPLSQSPAEGWQMVCMEALAGGLPVVKNAAGEVVGVLSEHGRGRTAVLGLGLEQDKFLTDPGLAPLLLDNGLTWLLGPRLATGERHWSNRIAVAVPARAEVTGVEANGRPVARFAVTRTGSVRRVTVPVEWIREGESAEVRVSYRPLSPARNVETMIHLPWGTMSQPNASASDLAGYLQSLGATIVQPLLRGSNGHAWYRGMPQDQPDENLVTNYRGNFLADLIRECHARGMKVIGGIYFNTVVPARTYPEARQLNPDGSPKTDRQGSPVACLNNPKGQEYNLATVEQLLMDYNLDGVILDDNYELDWYINNCFCEFCEQGLRDYCESKGLPYRAPAERGDSPQPGRSDYRRQATRALVAKVRAIAKAHRRPAGAWVSVTMDSLHLVGHLDFLGGMVYTSPPRAIRALLPRMGDSEFACLLWAPQASPETIRRETREAVHAGAATVGFWVMGSKGGYRLDPAGEAAVRDALGNVEEEWTRFYRQTLLSGDARFAVMEGRAGKESVILRVMNTGRRVAHRVQGPVVVDFSQ